ncbi:glucosyltransferase domain-containing protein [Paraglaciecola sp. MB-3u-78]|jgi:hypothetical protein|uniref:glucosyltransferase domain-containing protein n=1 Tax=Paraglaciecola sp. MB-3u-78 TaxID=2058332 RepID=UPI000C3282DE|nr:glucosyltransferase domain-containing protein [Paraglaciecola sp. MB-3u-78]PKG93009.1 hypothetical protein CXF95_29055 [Paraglaciecola sp. MB-3u-78]
MKKTSLFKISMPEQKSELIWFILISLFFVYPLIHADIYYRDDLTRVVQGAYIWDSLGRNLASYVTAVLSGSGISMTGQKFTLVDIAPLSQIYVGLFLGLTAYVFNEYLKVQTGKGIFWASLLIALNPFFISNILYRYDSPAMTLGVLLTVFAFCYASFFKRSAIVTPLLLIAVLFLYQPMANIFIGLIAIEIIILSTRCSASILFKTFVVRSAQFISSYIAYYILIKLFFNVSSRSELVSLNYSGFINVIDNFISYGHASKLFLHYSLKVPILIFLFVTVIAFLMCLWRTKDKLKFCCISLVSVVLLFLSLAGPLAILSEPLVDYRVISSFYLFFVFGVLICAMAHPKMALIGIIPAIIAINTSYLSGMALKNQRDFDENLFTLIQKDLLDNNIDGIDIYILGSAPVAPHAVIANNKNKFIETINPPAAGWQAAGLLREKGVANVQYIFSAEFTSLKDVFKKDLCDEVPQEVSKNALYSIYLSVDKVYILLSTNQIKYCAA